MPFEVIDSVFLKLSKLMKLSGCCDADVRTPRDALLTISNF